MMSKNVMIPLFLFDQIIALLQHWDISAFSPDLRYDYDNVVWSLAAKKQKLNLRNAYTNIIQADSQQAKVEAYSRYLQHKSLLAEAEWNIPF
jgi:hypothetical protein